MTCQIRLGDRKNYDALLKALERKNGRKKRYTWDEVENARRYLNHRLLTAPDSTLGKIEGSLAIVKRAEDDGRQNELLDALVRFARALPPPADRADFEVPKLPRPSAATGFVAFPWRRRHVIAATAVAAIGVVVLWPDSGGGPSGVSRPAGSGGQTASPSSTQTSPRFVEEEESLGLGRAVWRNIQAGVAEEGFSPGATDGIPGDATREALRGWQRSRGLPETGYLDSAQVAALEAVGEHAAARLAARLVPAPRPAGRARAFIIGSEFRDCAVCPEMVLVPSGSYQMGTQAGARHRHEETEHPRHTVRIGYLLAVGKYEVTFEEWDACVRGGGCGGHRPDDRGWGRGRRPVMVSWEDAQAYVSWLSGETGEGYRLPSESEWEYVARAGARTIRHWGDSEAEQCGYANGADAALEAGLTEQAREDAATSFVSCNDGYVATAPVGAYGANAFGLYDVLGNVDEWTEDCVHGRYSGAPADGGAWTTGECDRRITRGGHFFSASSQLRSAARTAHQIGVRGHAVGIRVVRTIR